MNNTGEKRSRAAKVTQGAGERGPRGGTTTVTQRGWRKKNLWLPPEMAEELRDKAFRHHLAEAVIVRRALEAYLPKLGLALGTIEMWGPDRGFCVDLCGLTRMLFS